MKVGRLILTHRQDMVGKLKEFYLNKRTDFLIIAYNQVTVDPSRFEEEKNFKFFPYIGQGPSGNVLGQQYVVWTAVAKAFPEIDFWVIHDYDLLCKPKDSVISPLVRIGEYGILGNPFKYLVVKNKVDRTDTFPFFYNDLAKSLNSSPVYAYLRKELLDEYGVEAEGEKSIVTGYGDFMAIHRQDLLRLDSQKLNRINKGGIEIVPHTVFAFFGIIPVDLRANFSMYISLDNTLYAPFKNTYDFSHPVKFWPNTVQPSFIMKLKRFLKLFLKYNRIARSRPENFKNN